MCIDPSWYNRVTEETEPSFFKSKVFLWSAGILATGAIVAVAFC